MPKQSRLPVPRKGTIENLAFALNEGFTSNSKRFSKIDSQSRRSGQGFTYFDFLYKLRTSTGLSRRAFGAEKGHNIEVFASQPYGLEPNRDVYTKEKYPLSWQRLLFYKESGKSAMSGSAAIVHVHDPGTEKGPGIEDATPFKAMILDRRWEQATSEGVAVHYVDPDMLEDDTVQTIVWDGTSSTIRNLESIVDNLVDQEFYELANTANKPAIPIAQTRVARGLGRTASSVGSFGKDFWKGVQS